MHYQYCSLLFPVLLDSSLNPAAAPFPSESLLNPTTESYHPPSASSDIPSLPAPFPASPDSPLVVAPEFRHDELASTFPIQPNKLDPSFIPHDKLDDLIKSSLDQFLSSKNWSQFVEFAHDPLGASNNYVDLNTFISFYCPFIAIFVTILFKSDTFY